MIRQQFEQRFSFCNLHVMTNWVRTEKLNLHVAERFTQVEAYILPGKMFQLIFLAISITCLNLYHVKVTNPGNYNPSYTWYTSGHTLGIPSCYQNHMTNKETPHFMSYNNLISLNLAWRGQKWWEQTNQDCNVNTFTHKAPLTSTLLMKCTLHFEMEAVVDCDEVKTH